MARRRKRKYDSYNQKIIMLIIALIVITLYSCFEDQITKYTYSLTEKERVVVKSYDINDVPDYGSDNYIYINNNEPYFEESDYTTESYEEYSDLDELGRCGAAMANISKDLMPTKERESIGMVKPSGWHTVKYDFISGKYLYNRCHLIGYQLTGENANAKNLITCTRNMNSVGMLEFENKVADYVKTTNNHVLYRVTPVYHNDDLLAYGVLMEAYSIEDNGEGIKFNVFVYNVEDGVEIDYSTGDSKLKE